ncbi:MAG: 30S ribosomal protein S12 methylthiotransferase RimO [Verrucomicrobia bacterium]|nr:30S ribosomal protein S12 methylthiotransferase RimO [Verrucomicrobiota bacterium]
MKRLQNSGNKIHFVSLGCARNLVDTEVMLGILLKSGYEVTDQVDKADYLVVNTCGFLASARQESCDTIDSLFEGKKKSAKVIVAGCMVQKHKDELKTQFPDIHYFLGSGDMEKILEAVESSNQGEAVTSARSYLEWGEIPRQLSTPKNYAYLKIAEGCAKQCAFCIIPKIKGPLRSKPQEQVLKEFDALLSQGVHEIILIAQDLGDYGKERKEISGLENLVREMLKRKGNFWIRFLYLYPDEITDELLSLMASDSRICAYLDMPIQHINDKMLKAMRRKTNREQIIHTIETLRKKLPGAVIRTSLMVGFPGETEEQFEELVRFVKEHPLDNIGIFKYSREEESPSAKMDGHLSEEIKQARYEKLATAQMKVVRKRNRAYIGQKLKVIVEGYHPDSPYLMRGRFYGQCPEIDGQVIITDGRLVDAFGKFYEVEITDVADYDLIGHVLGPVETKKAPAPKSTKLSLV